MGTDKATAGPLLTTEDVARRLGVSVKLINSWRHEGKGPEYIRFGHRTVRYRPEAVDAFIKRHARRPA